MNILLYPIPLPRVLNAAKKKELPKKELLQTHLFNEISAPPESGVPTYPMKRPFGES